jgi:cilia- and flagella-associated protein 57
MAKTPTSEEMLIVTLDNGQIYKCQFNIDQIEETKFEHLSYSFHCGPVMGLDICIRKPLVVTCGVDKSVRIWNYLEKSLEICEFFPEEAYSVAFHPSGFHLIVGFADKVKLINVFTNKLKVFKEIPIKVN